MGSLFTINLNYEEEPKRALVCMYEDGYETMFKIHVFNQDLYTILPDGNMEYTLTAGLITPRKLPCGMNS